MQTALKNFALFGYDAVTMKDIAATVGIRAASHQNRERKSELFNRLVEQGLIDKDGNVLPKRFQNLPRATKTG